MPRDMLLRIRRLDFYLFSFYFSLVYINSFIHFFVYIYSNIGCSLLFSIILCFIDYLNKIYSKINQIKKECLLYDDLI